jgi:Asp-tRNA(Asn)/Glu-tRNA(Gln) amidotransferase A subunit family amidase
MDDEQGTPWVPVLADIGGLTLTEAAGDPGCATVADALAREGEPGGPLRRRTAELTAATGQGLRPRTRANLDLLAAYERLERLGRPVNAVAAAAPLPARAADGPLAGRPVGIKDIIAVAGLPTRCGSPASDPAPAAADAPAVARLRAAGAEVFATTQCLEYAAGFAHPQIGDTRNPHDTTRTSGGSSGGSAALVAAGVCDLALGTDTGGSIRIPAAYCGVVGLKPSFGAIPEAGVFPLSPSCDHVGTLTATVAGTTDLLTVLAEPGALGPAGAEQKGPAGEGTAPGHQAPDAFTLGVLTSQLADPSVTPAVRAALDAALTALTAAGWTLREVDARWLDDLRAWEDVLGMIVAREAVLAHQGRDTARYAEGTRALLGYGATVGDEAYAQALARRDELAAAIDASLAGLDALAGPTVGFQAPEQDPPFGAGESPSSFKIVGETWAVPTGWPDRPGRTQAGPAVSRGTGRAGLPRAARGLLRRHVHGGGLGR